MMLRKRPVSRRFDRRPKPARIVRNASSFQLNATRFPRSCVRTTRPYMPGGSPIHRKPTLLRLNERSRVLPPGPDEFLVVGIGASAGGLEACTKLVGALPRDNGMAFILVQHLDPTHDSMMAELLASHTQLAVRQAAHGMLLERENLYIIPPGTYLSVGGGALRLSEPEAPRGARLPFDFLLHSLAEEYGRRAVCVVLSGTGADGSLGLQAVKKKGGLAIAQDPREAAYDGMPRSAISTSALDLVLPATEIPDALLTFAQRGVVTRAEGGSSGQPSEPSWLAEVIDLLRTTTAHDFTLYKKGTLRRRIEQRMAKASIETNEAGRYLELLRSDSGELELLAKDLLIHVTTFFRDRKVFEYLSETVVPELLRDVKPDRTIRIWSAGCSTGEEPYSLAMLFMEQMTAAERDVRIQIFASDIDPDAIANARQGLYPCTIENEVSPARLARFFLREGDQFRVVPELRAAVVFTVQDLLTDAPFSSLDLVSCRNLLIYLDAEAQAKVASVLHFALRDGGVLLLGNSETPGDIDERFKVISKSERTYRRIGRGRPRHASSLSGAADRSRQGSGQAGGSVAPLREASLSDLCRGMVVDAFAPATVLINRKNECLFSLGPTDRYLRMAPGDPTLDVLAMARRDVGTKLNAAIHRARREDARVVVAGGRLSSPEAPISFSIDAQPVSSQGEQMLLVCFVEERRDKLKPKDGSTPSDVLNVAEIEKELEATTIELDYTFRSLEILREEHRATTEEAKLINEEYQATNEELLASREEMQTLNEELIVLNNQLQETLEQQRTTFSDLQNVIFSTDVATIFLDIDLRIRFFTPATNSLFHIIQSDIGRPLADLSSLATDDALLADAKVVLLSLAAVEREIEAPSGLWFVRRILPYRTVDSGVQGVVITFVDITERKHAAEALEAAKRQSELANIAKSRFVAAASHDLRQPLQTLALLHGLLERAVEGDKALALVTRLDRTLGAMSSLLNTLLDINQIEAGIVKAETSTFKINDLLDRLREEFTYLAQAQSLTLHVLPCGLSIRSDARLLEQMVRNLLSNALKYTKQGKVVVGCRRRNGGVSIEIWDTGIGIPQEELQAIFEEYHQVDNAARERGRGLGLGLSIVQRLANLLGHPVRVRSRRGRGSVFTIEAELATDGPVQQLDPVRRVSDSKQPEVGRHTGSILVVEDDPDVCELLETFLIEQGYRTATAPDGSAAMELATRGTVRPDLVIADYNLPKGLNGLQLAERLRETFDRELPVIILTGDISAETLRNVSLKSCAQLTKPVRLPELTAVIQRLLSRAMPSRLRPPPEAADASAASTIFIVDDDRDVCQALSEVCELRGYTAHVFPSSEAFLKAYRPGAEACLLIDAYLPGLSGLELLRRLRDGGDPLPAVMITGNSDVQMAVKAMKSGAADFLEKPIRSDDLFASVERTLERSRDSRKVSAWREAAARQLDHLTVRERQIMDLVLAGYPSKNIAADLGISQRTVENHRASIMRKTGSRSLPALARLALAAAKIEGDE